MRANFLINSFSSGSSGHVESSFVNPAEKALSKSSSFSGSITEFENNSYFFIENDFP